MEFEGTVTCVETSCQGPLWRAVRMSVKAPGEDIRVPQLGTTSKVPS